MAESKKKHLAFCFKLEPSPAQSIFLSKTAGCCRFVHNCLLSDNFEDYQEYLEELESRLIWGEASTLEEAKALTQPPVFINKYTFNYQLQRYKGNLAYRFLKEPPSQALQQAAADLYSAFVNYFKHGTGKPQFHKKFQNDSFRLPQGFKFKEEENMVFLPKIGWVKYHNSRKIVGTVKHVTIKHEAEDEWFISACCEVDDSDYYLATAADSKSEIGLDLGIAHLVTLSDGSFPLQKEYDQCMQAAAKEDAKIAKLQRSLARKRRAAKKNGQQKRSNNYMKELNKLRHVWQRITNLINDLLHKISTYIAQNHGGTVVVEDLKIKNMMKSARGTASNPGRNVSQKAGLNRSIARVSWRKLLSMLEYKLERYGGRLVFVNPKYTSQTCPKCGHVSPKNRTEQAKFKCTQCGYEANADVNAAQNILNRYQLTKGRACPDGLCYRT